MHESVQLPKAIPGIAVTKVAAPSLRPAVDLADHLGDGNETLSGSGQLSNLLAGSSHRLGRGCHVEVAMRTAEAVAVVSQA